jgi:hypothetical protein
MRHVRDSRRLFAATPATPGCPASCCKTSTKRRVASRRRGARGRGLGVGSPMAWHRRSIRKLQRLQVRRALERRALLRTLGADLVPLRVDVPALLAVGDALALPGSHGRPCSTRRRTDRSLTTRRSSLTSRPLSLSSRPSVDGAPWTPAWKTTGANSSIRSG